jgi:hypothetical protein
VTPTVSLRKCKFANYIFEFKGRAGHTGTKPIAAAVQATAKNLATGVERSTATNETGYYLMTFLSLAQYQVTASMAGFATVVAEQVDVTLNKPPP